MDGLRFGRTAYGVAASIRVSGQYCRAVDGAAHRNLTFLTNFPFKLRSESGYRGRIALAGY
jgi:hypothetical protein